MGVIEAGRPAPDFTLARARGESFTREDLLGATSVLVFYPFAFSPVCTDQLNAYEEVLDDVAERGATLYAVSCDATHSQQAFKEKLGVTIEQLSDFEPKGAACAAFCVLHPGGFAQRALVVVGPDGVVKWSYEAPSPGDLPGANLIFDGLEQVRASGLVSLSSAPPPDVRPEDHVRGPQDGRLVVVYADFECPYCAAVDARLGTLEVRLLFRHFPVRSKHPRAWPAAAAAEAAARQGAFWPMHDLLYGDQGRLEDPHLWSRAETLGLDVGAFETDRRSEAVSARIKADFRGGVRAGVASTPAVFADGRQLRGRPDEAALRQLAAGPAGSSGTL